MYVKGRFIPYGESLDEALEIRKTVFQDEQGMTAEMDTDGKDEEAVHVVAYEIGNESRPVATGRILMTENGFRIGKIAVLKEERGKHYGDFVVRMLVNKAFMAEGKCVTVSALLSAVQFYKKIGFRTIGEEYLENGTPHILMELRPEWFCTMCGQNGDCRKDDIQ